MICSHIVKVNMSFAFAFLSSQLENYVHHHQLTLNQWLAYYSTMITMSGVVLAVNARVITKDPKPFDSILKEIPELQLLIWTGTGEPPISKSKLSMITQHFENNGCMKQIGFDCQVRTSYYLLQLNIIKCFSFTN